jgi:hypothetical protein
LWYDVGEDMILERNRGFKKKRATGAYACVGTAPSEIGREGVLDVNEDAGIVVIDLV